MVARNRQAQSPAPLPPSPEISDQFEQQGPLGWKPYALAGVMALGLLSGCHQPNQLRLATMTPVVMKDGQLVYLPPSQTFEKPQDWAQREAVIRLKVPGERLVASLAVKDEQGRVQATRWTQGQEVTDNQSFDPKTGILTLKIRPTRAEVDPQGRTDEGFDPTRIRSIQVWLSPTGQQGLESGILSIVSQNLVDAGPAPPAAQVRPLLGHNSGPSQEMKHGVSRYFVYGDLHRWNESRPLMEKAFADQQQAGLSAFRNMGGLDLRRGGLDPAVFPAMREYLALAEGYGQSHHIFTLLDGAIPNPRLQKAYQDPAEADRLVEDLRPFIREFGQARIQGQPVIFDLINEVHGTAGAEFQKQELVEKMVRAFGEEAPGATLTVGVQNYRELQFWNYLFEKFAGQPVKFAMTFHVYEPMANLPDRRQLNIPDNVEVGITEADPNVGMAEQIRMAREKGYDWLLFWQDSSHPYQPAGHSRQLKP